MRTLAIDPGSKRIGLAMSDEGGCWASPLEVMMVNDPSHALMPIVQLIRREDVKRVVVGLPLNMDDSVGKQARLVVAWVDLLRHGCQSAGLSVQFIFVDERLSSFVAEQKLIEIKRAGAKMTRKDKKQSLDAVAAAGILQGFLDGTLPPIRLPE